MRVLVDTLRCALSSPPASDKRKASTAASGAAYGRASTARSVKRRKRAPRGECEIGALGKLPTEVLELILLNLEVKDLGRVASTCSYFSASGIVERVAAARVEAVPRAQVMVLTKKDSFLKAWHHCTFSERAERMSLNVSLGQFHTLCVGEADDATNEGKLLMTFGRGFHGQLGLHTFENHALPTRLLLDGEDVTGDDEETFAGVDSIAVGGSHSIILDRAGGVTSWGLASSGELGHFGTTPIEVNAPMRCRTLDSLTGMSKITQVITGANHTLAIDQWGRLFACGRGRSGQLGHGTFRDAAPFSQIAALRGMQVVSAVAGGAHSICITSDGNVWSWGDCGFGQLGLGDLTFASAAGWTSGIPWPCLVESLNDMDEPITNMAAGGSHSLFVTSGGRMYVCGRGKHGALGVGKVSARFSVDPIYSSGTETGNRLSPVQVNIHHYVRDVLRGEIIENRVQQCSCGARCRVAHASAGAMHSCVLTACGAVFTTGNNSYGQLGHGDKKKTFNFTRVEALRGKKVVTVASGHHHTGAVVESEEGRNDLYLWGRGDWGQLGTGDMRSYTKPKRVEGFHVAPARPESEVLMYKQTEMPQGEDSPQDDETEAEDDMV